MTIEDIKRKQAILIAYLKTVIPSDYKVVAEFNTNQVNNSENDNKMIVVQEQTGEKVVFFGDCSPIYNYFMIDIFAKSIQEAKNVSLVIGNLIGNNITHETTYTDPSTEIVYDEKWQILFKQYGNPQAISYEDIRRVGYTAVLKCIVNKIYSAEAE